MGLPAFLVAATAILSGGGGGGGGGGEEEETGIGIAVATVEPDSWETWSADNTKGSFGDRFNQYKKYVAGVKGMTVDELDFRETISGNSLWSLYEPDHVVSDYTKRIHATKADMKNDDRSFYDQRIREGTTDFDSWLSNQNADVKKSGYGAQYRKYKNQTNSILEQRPAWMGKDDSSFTTFDSYDPGLFVAGNDYGDFAGSYRNQGEADSKFRNYYAEQIGNFGYGNLIQDDMDNAGYLSAYNEAKLRNDYGSLITGLGYGSTYDSGMTSGQLQSLWADVQERDRYKNLLDEMGYDYDASDDATSLGYNYNQALAIEDTKAKLKAAQDAYSGLEGTYNSTVGEMGELQGEFDTLFGDYGTLTTDYGTLQGTYDALSGQYGDLEELQGTTKADLDAKAGEYDTLSGLYDTLTSNYGTMTTDYNTAIGDLGALQDNYDQLDKDKTALKGTYDELFGNYGTLSTDYDTLSDDFDVLTGVQTKTLADLDAERGVAEGLRRDARGVQSRAFLADNAADREKRIASGLGSIQAPTQPAYTQAMDALSGTALDPGQYSLKPIDFTGGFDPNVFQPTQMGGQMGPDAYGTTDYTDIFAGPQMGMSQGGFDLNQSFNPYFDALNAEYGVEIPSASYGLPAIGGIK